MKPGAREIIEAISLALDSEVAPHVTDPWAASALRSIHGLLAHLAVRVEMESSILEESNADLRELLAAAAGLLPALDDRATPAAGSSPVTPGQESASAERLHLPALAQLEQENEDLRAELERLIHALHAPDPDTDEAARREVLKKVREFFAREGEREAPLYRPLSGPMF